MELTIVDGNGRLALGFLCRFSLKQASTQTSVRLHSVRIVVGLFCYWGGFLGHLAVHHYLVIDAKLALRHPRQVGLHQDLRELIKFHKKCQ